MEGKQIWVINIKLIPTIEGSPEIENALHIAFNGSLKGYPVEALRKHLEKSLNAFIAKAKKEEVL